MDEDELNSLMESVRHRANTARSLNELAKQAQTNLIEKRQPLDAEDREQLRHSLHLLEKRRKQELAPGELTDVRAWLQNLAITLGLKFESEQKAAALSVQLQGKVCCVWVQLECESDNVQLPMSVQLKFLSDSAANECSLLLDYLQDGDLGEFEETVRHINSIVPSTADSNLQQQLFQCVNAARADLNTIINSGPKDRGMLEQIRTGTFGYISSASIDVLTRVHYFVHPLSLVDTKTQSFVKLSDSVLNKKRPTLFADLLCQEFGQLTPVIRKPLASGQSVNFFGYTDENSVKMKGCLSLRLSEPLVVTNRHAEQLTQITGFSPVPESQGSLLDLLAHQKLGANAPQPSGDDENIVQWNVALFEQRHSYRLDVLNHGHLSAVLISQVRVSGVHQLAELLGWLRRQALLNAVLATCLRHNSSEHKTVSTRPMFQQSGWPIELSCAGLHAVQCVLEPPGCAGGDLLSVKFGLDLEDMSVSISWAFGGSDSAVNVEALQAKAANVFKTSRSIPVTMRCVLKEFGLTADSRLPGQQPDRTADGDDEADDDEQTNGSAKSGGGRKRSAQQHKQHDDHKNPKHDSYWLDGGAGDTWAALCARPLGRVWTVSYSDTTASLPQPKALNFKVFPVDMDKCGVLRKDRHKSMNLLDLFGEVDEWEELVPPKKNQLSLKSPPPPSVGSKEQQQYGFNAFVPPSPVTGASASRPSELAVGSGQCDSSSAEHTPTSTQQQQQAADALHAAGKQAHAQMVHRHYSTGSETFAVLDQINQLAAGGTEPNTPQTPHARAISQQQQEGYRGQRSVDEANGQQQQQQLAAAGPSALTERRSSIADAIDSVVKNVNTPPPSSSPLSVSSLTGPGGSVSPATSSTPQTPSNSQSGLLSPRQQMQMQQQQQQQQHNYSDPNVFDFETSDPLEAAARAQGGGSRQQQQQQQQGAPSAIPQSPGAAGGMPQPYGVPQQQSPHSMYGGGGGSQPGTPISGIFPPSAQAAMQFNWQQQQQHKMMAVQQQQLAASGVPPHHQQQQQQPGKVRRGGSTASGAARKQRGRRGAANLGDRQLSADSLTAIADPSADAKAKRGAGTPRRARRGRAATTGVPSLTHSYSTDAVPGSSSLQQHLLQHAGSNPVYNPQQQHQQQQQQPQYGGQPAAGSESSSLSAMLGGPGPGETSGGGQTQLADQHQSQQPLLNPNNQQPQQPNASGGALSLDLEAESSEDNNTTSPHALNTNPSDELRRKLADICNDDNNNSHTTTANVNGSNEDAEPAMPQLENVFERFGHTTTSRDGMEGGGGGGGGGGTAVQVATTFAGQARLAKPAILNKQPKKLLDDVVAQLKDNKERTSKLEKAKKSLPVIKPHNARSADGDVAVISERGRVSVIADDEDEPDVLKVIIRKNSTPGGGGSTKSGSNKQRHHIAGDAKNKSAFTSLKNKVQSSTASMAQSLKNKVRKRKPQPTGGAQDVVPKKIGKLDATSSSRPAAPTPEVAGASIVPAVLDFSRPLKSFKIPKLVEEPKTSSGNAAAAQPQADQPKQAAQSAPGSQQQTSAQPYKAPKPAAGEPAVPRPRGILKNAPAPSYHNPAAQHQQQAGGSYRPLLSGSNATSVPAVRRNRGALLPMPPVQQAPSTTAAQPRPAQHTAAPVTNSGFAVPESQTPLSPTPDAPQSPDEPECDPEPVTTISTTALNTSKDSNDPASPALAIVEND